MNLAIDQSRLSDELESLGAISSDPAPAVTRVVFGPADLRARDFVRKLCVEAGLSLHEDAVGNLFARWAGAEPALPAVGSGSHIDAIPNAGKYDGTVGVLGGLEAIRALMRSGSRPRRSVELIAFTSEEPTRFGIGCLGSRLLSGVLKPACGETLMDRDGLTLNEVRHAANFTGPLAEMALAKGHYAAFVELHIEQGPMLEQKQLDIGVVTAIAAPASLKIMIEGQGGHAGAVLMPVRHDAFLAAAEIALAIEAAALSSAAIDTVATTGVCHVFPGAVNSIPSQVRLEVDVRDIDLARRDAVLDRIQNAAAEIAAKRGVAIRIEPVNADPPATCDPAVVTAVERACQLHGATSQRMISRAYHDSLFMSLLAPTGMIFIPCRGGVSHRPDEYSSGENIARGALVLAQTMAELAG